MTTVADTVYAEIRHRIADGRYRPGSRLGEESIAEEVGYSRTPVREALRRLAKEGLIDLEPNRGAYVSSWSPEDLQELFSCRALLESYAARLAAARIQPHQLLRLRDLADHMTALSNDPSPTQLAEIAELNGAFHKLVGEASGNRLLVDLMSRLIEMPLVMRTFQRYGADHLKRSMTQHSDLVDALEAGDDDWAEAVMRSHVFSGRNVMTTTWPPSHQTATAEPTGRKPARSRRAKPADSHEE